MVMLVGAAQGSKDCRDSQEAVNPCRESVVGTKAGPPKAYEQLLVGAVGFWQSFKLLSKTLPGMVLATIGRKNSNECNSHV